jgi:hypothetical protein
VLLFKNDVPIIKSSSMEARTLNSQMQIGMTEKFETDRNIFSKFLYYKI